MSSSAVRFAGDRNRCERCGTELAPHALACPACGALVHAERLKQIAASAHEASAAGDLAKARDLWESALRFLPVESRQHERIRTTVTGLTQRIEATPSAKPTAPAQSGWWRRGGAAIVSIAVLLIGKLKFLLLGLTKATTFISMFAFFGVYWSVYGWPLALGIVVSIYIHEMGHVAMLRRLGIAAGAPLFIPGVGAVVMLRALGVVPVTGAKIGLAGPGGGLGQVSRHVVGRSCSRTRRAFRAVMRVASAPPNEAVEADRLAVLVRRSWGEMCGATVDALASACSFTLMP